jgi:hypothetical protein
VAEPLQVFAPMELAGLIGDPSWRTISATPI